MNRIEKLLQKFCPDGVEFKALGGGLDKSREIQIWRKSNKTNSSYTRKWI